MILSVDSKKDGAPFLRITIFSLAGLFF
jgi:hypothetical protein